MNIVKLDLKSGLILINSTPITTEENGVLAGPILQLSSTPIQTDEQQIRYQLLGKFSIFGKSADCVIEIRNGTISAVTFLFDLIEFFESSILESRIIKACEKYSNLTFVSDHPSTAFLETCAWGQAIFFYDAKQGDLSLDIIFERDSNKPD